MNKADRDKLRRILEFHPGEIVPIPGTDTIVELLDQIDDYEERLYAIAEDLRMLERLINYAEILSPR